MALYREFTLIFTTNFVGSLNIRFYRDFFSIEVRSPVIVTLIQNLLLLFRSFLSV